MITSFLGVVVAESAMEAQLMLPAFMFTVPVRPAAGLGIVIAPVMVIEFAPLIVTTLLALIAAKVSEAH